MNHFDLGILDDEDEPTSADDSAEVDADDDFTEAERRLTLARYYQQLTKGGIFEGDDGEEARTVDAEIKQFARQRMNVLIGLQAELAPIAIELPFTDEQVTALKQLADRILERDVKPSVPVLRRVEPPPVAAKVAAARVKAPNPLKRKGKPALPRTAKSEAEKATPKVEAPPAQDYSGIATGEIFEEDGKKYKLVESRDLLDEDGSPKRIKMDVTEQTRSPQALPFPARHVLEYTLERHAGDSLQAAIANDPVAMRAAAKSMNQP